MPKRIVKLVILLLIIGITRINTTNASFTSQQTVSGNHISTGCWIAPSVPTLVFPANDSYAGSGSSWDLNPVMDWNDSSSTCPLPTTISYQYESYSDAGLTHLLFQSGWLALPQIPAPGTPDGVYYWHVRAKDNWGNTSAFSPTWKFTVDRVKPTSTITTPANNGSNSIVYSTSWDGVIAGTALDNLSGVNHVDLSIHRASDDTYWNGTNWVSGTESTVRVPASGTTSWTYTVNDHSTVTDYTITSHAVDNAGNVENSYVVDISCKNPQQNLLLSIPDITPTATPEATPTVSLILSPDKKTISFDSDNVSAYTKLNYTITYDAYTIMRGIGPSEVSLNGQNSYSSQDFDLATCSSGVCTYDQDVHDFTLEVTLTDNGGKTVTLNQKL